MIGIVVVSHSRALGNAAAQLAVEMVPEEARPRLKVAAGLDETTFGTDAAAIAEAIEAVDSGDGVLVLLDLGSAILSAEMALEFIDPEVAGRTRISSAPLVEGLIAAVVTASTGATLDEVCSEAANGLVGKQEQLGDSSSQSFVGDSSFVADPSCLGGIPPHLASDGNPEGASILRRWGTPPPGADVAAAGDDSKGVEPDSQEEHAAKEESLSSCQRQDLRSAEAGAQRTFRWEVRNEHGLHARPAAALVSGLRGIKANCSVSNCSTGKGPVAASSLTSIQALGLRKGDVMEVQITGDDAELAYSRLAEMAETDFGDSPRAETPDSRPEEGRQSAVARTEADPGRTGRQIAIGEAHHMVSEPDTSGYVAGDQATERGRLDAAAEAVRTTLQGLARTGDSGIYEVQGLMLDDVVPQLREEVDTGESAVRAVRERFTALAAELEGLDDPYLKARAEDQRGLQRMMLRALMGYDAAPAAAHGILIVDELDPATAGSVDPETCLGIITTSGGATGHGAILAQARGFALLTGKSEAVQIPEGTLVAIDPVEDKLWVDPDEDEVDALKATQARRQMEASEASRLSHEPARTLSGSRVLVEANIASLQDARDAHEAGAEGSGLVRTEVLFGKWDHEPTGEEQADIFIQIGRILDAPITIRTWDPGGDKPLGFLPQDPEANPMLGERGIRAMKRLPHLLDEQLTAVLLAGKEVPVRVMFPMIALPEEMVWARFRLAPILERVGGQIEVGMMVETPAAAVRATDFLDVADFISVGTNDLTQYTMAVDRGNPQVASVAKGPNTAVWDLISMAGHAFAGRPVAVCGDLASHPELVGQLIESGVTELSVRAPLVGVVKQAVRRAS